MTSNYTLTTWPYYSAEESRPPESQVVKADNDKTALTLAEQVIPPGKIVGTLTAPDGRIIARRYVIVHKIDVGEGMRMEAGSWQFFAANDEEAKKVLAEKTVDWKNILHGPDGIIAHK